MKVAFCLRGIHYLINDDDSVLHRNTDFETCIENHKKFLFNDLASRNIDVDIFISTYHSDKDNKLIETFKPVDIYYDSLNKYENCSAQLRHHYNCANMIINYEIANNFKYDYIISTRFDYVFF